MATPNKICFYDESLKKQIEGNYRYDGKAIHVISVEYGARSAPRGGCLDHNEFDMLAQKVLSELARDTEQKVLSELARDAEKDSVTSHSLKKAA